MACGARATGFIFLVALSVAWLWRPLSTLILLSLESHEYEHYSHIAVIPLVSLVLIYLDRQAIFASVRSGYRLGIPLIMGGLALGLASQALLAADGTGFTGVMLGAVTLWIGAFILCYGTAALKAASFPLAFLLLMIPLPAVLLDAVITFLQWGSTELTYGLFVLLGVPVFREGVTFALPGLTIEVARECSGIRSSLALFITALLIGHFSLRSSWAKTALVLVAIPLALVKNAIRIAALSLLAIHVDPGFITGRLHERGGVVFFLTAVTLLWGVTCLLKRLEDRSAHQGGRDSVLPLSPARR